MAIHLEGTLHTVEGETTSSYLRVEYVRIKPWEGIAEYNPAIYYSGVEAEESRKKYFQDEMKIHNIIPHVSMSYEFSGSNSPLKIQDYYVFPITGSPQPVTVNHYTHSIISESYDMVDFDDDGNEIITHEIRYVSQSTLYSSSIEYKNEIDLNLHSNIFNSCYNHLKEQILAQVVSGSIKDI